MRIDSGSPTDNGRGVTAVVVSGGRVPEEAALPAEAARAVSAAASALDAAAGSTLMVWADGKRYLAVSAGPDAKPDNYRKAGAAAAREAAPALR
ncbi:MAG TPA: hypothetical protein VNT60_09900 [Deinococcales bacterium]|nr:hypothetical protein [Deinococcales bacterium]